MIKLIAIAKNEERYIKEWVDYHMSLGFDEIIIYDNSGNGELKSEGKLTVYDAPGTGMQLKAYADAINQMKYGEWRTLH